MTEREEFEATPVPKDLGQLMLSVQRICGGPGLFNEANTANAIRSLVAGYEAGETFTAEDLATFLLAIADALDHPAATTVLRTGYRSRGRPETNIDVYLRARREEDAAYDMFCDFQKYGQIEPAVAQAAADRDISRTTVFALLKRVANRFADERREVGHNYLSPGDEQSAQFVNWLNRYLDETPAKDG